MKTFTIGFTRKSAEQFFGLLQAAGITRVIDVRLHNVSQLAGFAKRDDLRFFLRTLSDAEYVHLPQLAPEPGMLRAYRRREISWQKYQQNFLELMAKRHIERTIDLEFLHNSCLLCSEHEPHQCHRRLVVEYLNARCGAQLEVEHLQ